MILAGDLGGTNARLSLHAGDGKRVLRQDVYETRRFDGIEAAARVFLGADLGKVNAACFGVAGPVLNQRCTMPNLGWVVDARLLSRRLRIPKFTLVNDLVALGMGAFTVPRKKLHFIQGEARPSLKLGNVAVVAAGTGLGETVFVSSGSADVITPLATEGGHADFAPRTPDEFALLEFVQRRVKGHVSTERIISGPGLGHIYDFFRTRREVEKNGDADAISSASDRNAEIGKLGALRKKGAAADAFRLFVRLYGAETGNHALRTLATGGIFIAGKIAEALVAPEFQRMFTDAFLDKGRMRPLLEKIPMAIVLDSYIGLAGSALYAAKDYQQE